MPSESKNNITDYLKTVEFVRDRLSKEANQVRAEDRYITRNQKDRRDEILARHSTIKDLITYNDDVTNISTEEIRDYYLPDIVQVHRCIGDDLSRSIHEGVLSQPSAANHLEMVIYIALRSIEALNANPNSWTSVSGKPESVLSPSTLASIEPLSITADDYFRIAWLRALFRCVLCMPIGYMVSHTSLRGSDPSSPSWSPASQDIVDYIDRYGPVLVGNSQSEHGHVQLSPRLISFSTYLRLYERSPSEIPMLSLFEADFFADKPSKRNPLYIAFNDAMKHVFYDRFYTKFPYWWVLAINHHFIRDENYSPIECVVTAEAGKEWRKYLPEVLRQAQLDENEEESPDSVSEPPSDAARQPQSQTDLLPLVSASVKLCHELYIKEDFRANCGGAVYQRYSGDTYIVFPLFFNRLEAALNRPAVTYDKIHMAFIQDGLLDASATDAPETAFEIIRSGTTKRLGKVRGLKLSDTGVSLLFPDGVPFGDNADLKLLRNQPSATAA
jgi:hypothetical protein